MSIRSAYSSISAIVGGSINSAEAPSVSESQFQSINRNIESAKSTELEILKSDLRLFSNTNIKENCKPLAHLKALFGTLDGLFQLETYADTKFVDGSDDKLNFVAKLGLLRIAVGNIFKALKDAGMEQTLDQFEKSRVTTPQARTNSETPATSENPIKTIGWRQLLHHPSAQTKTEEVA